MQLRDHFHAPLSNRRHWESFHSAWINHTVRFLAPRLPARYYAEPEVHLGIQVEPDLATFEEVERPMEPASSGNGIATAVWTATAATRSAKINIPAQDTFEVRVVDTRRASRLVAVIELVSPRNKDRPDARRDFAIKCASYLQQQISVVLVDVVTDRQHDLYGELLTLLDQPRGAPWPGDPPLYAVALRTTKEGNDWRMDAWEETLSLGGVLPTLPLWLASDLAVSIELESTYEETCKILRIV